MDSETKNINENKNITNEADEILRKEFEDMITMDLMESIMTLEDAE